MQATLTTWGNSLGIRIPKNLATMLDFNVGTKIKLEVDKDRIILSKPKEYELASLVAGITEKNKPEIIEWDAPKGKEIW